MSQKMLVKVRGSFNAVEFPHKSLLLTALLKELTVENDLRTSVNTGSILILF